MKYYNYNDFKKDTNELISLVENSEFDGIVGIARGGLTLSHAMSEGLDIRQVQSIRTELYDGTNKRDQISIFGSCDFDTANNILVVDDIADSGDTLKAVMEHLISTHENVKFTSATLFYKRTSIYEPDFWINEAKEWIEFFWEKDFTK